MGGSGQTLQTRRQAEAKALLPASLVCVVPLAVAMSPRPFLPGNSGPQSHGSSHPGVLGALHLLISELLHHPLLSFFALLFPR